MAADVAAPLAQRRHAHDEALEPVEEVAPEVALRDALLERSVRGRDDAHVGAAAGPRRADAADLVAVEGAQELRLRLERQVADLVEEQRAPLRLGEGALAGARARR